MQRTELSATASAYVPKSHLVADPTKAATFSQPGNPKVLPPASSTAPPSTSAKPRLTLNTNAKDFVQRPKNVPPIPSNFPGIAPPMGGYMSGLQPYTQYEYDQYDYPQDYSEYQHYSYPPYQQPSYPRQYYPVNTPNIPPNYQPRPQPSVHNTPPPPTKTGSIIKTDVVVTPTVVDKEAKAIAAMKEAAKNLPEFRPKKSETPKEEAKQLPTLSKPKLTEQKVKEPETKKIKVEPKVEEKKEDVKEAKIKIIPQEETKVISKEEKAPSLVSIPQKKSDLQIFREITKNSQKNDFTYEIIVKIGSELAVCHMKPKLLVEDLLNRPMLNGRKELVTREALTRRVKTEEEKTIERDAKAREKLLAESAKVQDDKGDLKLALNKLTPENYTTMAEKIWKLKGKSAEVSEILVDLIFKKAWSEQKYIGLYGKLCKGIICRELKVPESKLSKNEMKKSKFRDSIITKCQKTFDNRSTLKEDLKTSSKTELSEDEIELIHRKMIFGSTLYL